MAFCARSLTDRDSQGSELAALVATDVPTAQQLLTLYEWKEEKLKTVFFQNRAATLARVGVADDTSGHKKIKTGPDAVVECPVCFGDVPATAASSLACGHMFCNACWTDHLNAQASAGRALKTRCLSSSCPALVHVGLWQRLGGVAMQRWTQQLRDDYVVHRFADCKPCPFASCTNLVWWHGEANIPVECICSNRWCYKCQDADRGDHAPASCKDTDQWMAKFKSEADNMIWMKAHSKPCPKCTRAVVVLPCADCGPSLCRSRSH